MITITQHDLQNVLNVLGLSEYSPVDVMELHIKYEESYIEVIEHNEDSKTILIRIQDEPTYDREED